MKHRIRARFKRDEEPAELDPEVKKKYLAGANWRNQGFKDRSKKGKLIRAKKSVTRVVRPPKEGWNPGNLGTSYKT